MVVDAVLLLPLSPVERLEPVLHVGDRIDRDGGADDRHDQGHGQAEAVREEPEAQACRRRPRVRLGHGRAAAVEAGPHREQEEGDVEERGERDPSDVASQPPGRRERDDSEARRAGRGRPAGGRRVSRSASSVPPFSQADAVIPRRGRSARALSRPGTRRLVHVLLYPFRFFSSLASTLSWIL